MSVPPAGVARPTVDELLAGPRGRRLCLALAQQVSDELHSTVLEVSYALDPEAGRGARGWFVLVGHEEDGVLARFALAIRRRTTAASIRLRDAYLRIAHTSGHPPRKDREVADAARLLEAVPLDAMTSHHIDLALREAVDFARYWQQPDGEDALAARHELRPGLERVARALLTRDDICWWGESASPEQWYVQWADETTLPRRGPRPLPDPEEDRRHAVSLWSLQARADEAEDAEERRKHPRQHWSGTWWSLPPGPVTVGHLPEAVALVEDGDGSERATLHPVQAPGRTVEIRRPSDWVELCRRFPLEVTASRRDDWHDATGRTGRWVIPDWSQVADVYDAVHLSVWGYLTTAGRALPVEQDIATVMAGCTAGGTWWLTRVPVPTGAATRTVAYDDEADRWAEAAADDAGRTCGR
jgi:hypothetical protein